MNRFSDVELLKTLRMSTGCLLLWAMCSVSAFAERPNVLLFLVDDLGYSDPGFMGGEIPTPNLDALAANGLRFTQCYNSARCCPSRASLVTGLYPHQTGIGSFATDRPSPKKGPAYLGHLNDECVTLAEVLGGAGYQTYMIGKWHMGEPGPIARGFDEFYGFVKGYEQDQWKPERYQRLPEGRTPELEHADGEFYATDVFTDYALEFLTQANQKPDQPWFLYLAHSAPHFPVQAPKETVDELVEQYRKGWDVLREERFERMKNNGLADATWTLTERSPVPIDGDAITNGFSGKQNPAWVSLPADRQEDLSRRMAIFAAMVVHVDRGLGRIVEQLRATGQLENTIILFLSDNGACYEWGPFGFDGPSRSGVTTLHTGDELLTMGGPGTYHSYGSGWSNLCNTPFRLYKHFTYEGGNCTPLLVHWPAGISQPNRWVNTPVHLIDVMPTLREVAQADYPRKFNGQTITPEEGTSLIPVWNGESLSERPIASEHNGSRSLRKGDWKVVWPVRMPWESTWELYNLAEDRSETNNLAELHPEKLQELAADWDAWGRRVQVDIFYRGEGAEMPPTVNYASPRIARVPLELSLQMTVQGTDSSGVLVAHGGREQGYALHLEQGKVVWTVRVNGKAVSTPPVAIPPGTSNLVATLDANGSMTLKIDQKTAATAQASGLIPVQPKDELTIKEDALSAVGDYIPPHRFQGKVTDVRVNELPIQQDRK